MAEQGGGNRVREQEKGGKESYNTTDWMIYLTRWEGNRESQKKMGYLLLEKNKWGWEGE